MDTRYQDNLSPEPSALQGCFKTPDINTFNHLNSVHALYPTPPSDTEESGLITRSNPGNNLMITPRINSSKLICKVIYIC